MYNEHVPYRTDALLAMLDHCEATDRDIMIFQGMSNPRQSVPALSRGRVATANETADKSFFIGLKLYGASPSIWS